MSERIFEPVWHDLTDAERQQLGGELAAHAKQLIDLREAKAAMAADYNAKIKAELIDITALAHKLTTGGEMRDIEVMVMLDHPEPGQKSVLDAANNKILRTEPMTAKEKQSSFGFQEPSA